MEKPKRQGGRSHGKGIRGSPEEAERQSTTFRSKPCSAHVLVLGLTDPNMTQRSIEFVVYQGKDRARRRWRSGVCNTAGPTPLASVSNRRHIPHGPEISRGV